MRYFFFMILLSGFGLAATVPSYAQSANENTVMEEEGLFPPQAEAGKQETAPAADKIRTYEESPQDNAPPLNEPTHPPLRLTPDKSTIVELSAPAARIIIGNDNHVNVLTDTARRLVVVPRVPGATHFAVLGTDGKVVMQRHVIVASPKEEYIRIRRTCGEGESCEDTSVYYCPDMCHEIMLDDGTGGGANSGGRAGDQGFPGDEQEGDENGDRFDTEE